jgi:hypothetical protein
MMESQGESPRMAYTMEILRQRREELGQITGLNTRLTGYLDRIRKEQDRNIHLRREAIFHILFNSTALLHFQEIPLFGRKRFEGVRQAAQPIQRTTELA